MAGEYDKQFDQLTGLVETLTGTVTGLEIKVDRSLGGLDELRMEVRDIRNEVRDVRNELRDNTAKLDSLTGDVKILSAQFKDVAGVVIRDHHPRIDKLEERVDVLESGTH